MIVQLLNTEANTRANRSSIILLDQMSEKLTNVFQEISYFSNIFYWDKELNSIISDRQANNMYQLSRDERAVDNLFLSNTYAFDTYRYGVAILGTNGKQYSSIKTDRLHEIGDITQYSWYNKALRENGQIVYLPADEVGQLANCYPDTAIFALRQMSNLISGRSIGIMAISVKKDYLADICSKLLDPVSQRVIIVDEKGSVIYATDVSLLGVNIETSPYYNNLTDYYSGYFVSKVSGQNAQVVFTTNKMTDWKIIMYTPTQLSGSNQNFVFVIITVVAILYLMIALFMSYYTAKTISRPVKKLRNAMVRLQEGDLSVRIALPGNDELGQLSSQFNKTVVQIAELLTKLEQQEEKKRILEMQALQAQINPHFLYNTLASIRFMLELDMPGEADEALLALVKLLKKTFSNPQKLVNIEEEIETVDHYLRLLKIRHNAHFSWEINVEDDIASNKILKFVLQPLVENSITHGFCQKDGLGFIQIVATKVGDDIIILVKDNGVGGDINYINGILNGTESERNTDGFNGIGMKNVHDRLQLFFGREYGLTVLEGPDNGIVVKVKIPGFTNE